MRGKTIGIGKMRRIAGDQGQIARIGQIDDRILGGLFGLDPATGDVDVQAPGEIAFQHPDNAPPPAAPPRSGA
jgi:hypothetical protein